MQQRLVREGQKDYWRMERLMDDDHQRSALPEQLSNRVCRLLLLLRGARDALCRACALLWAARYRRMACAGLAPSPA